MCQRSCSKCMEPLCRLPCSYAMNRTEYMKEHPILCKRLDKEMSEILEEHKKVCRGFTTERRKDFKVVKK